jgi:thioredoxin reductase (NADPH)
MEFVLNTVLTQIRGEGKVQGVTARNVQTGQSSEIECEGVFIFVGHDPNTGFLKTILPQHAGGIIPVDFNMETAVKGVYAVGDVRVGSYRQVGTAIGDAITAAMHAEIRIKELLAK